MPLFHVSVRSKPGAGTTLADQGLLQEENHVPLDEAVLHSAGYRCRADVGEPEPDGDCYTDRDCDRRSDCDRDADRDGYSNRNGDRSS